MQNAGNANGTAPEGGDPNIFVEGGENATSNDGRTEATKNATEEAIEHKVVSP